MKRMTGILLAVIILGGCSEQEIKYKEQLRSISEVEEIIADELEVENPNLDLQVDVFEEIE